METLLISSLGKEQSDVDAILRRIKDDKIISRIWATDHTVWRHDPVEITNRLGWLNSPDVMTEKISEIRLFVQDVRDAGFTQGLLLGMGGSSLASDVFRKTFGVASGYLDLSVLDTTDPDAIRNTEDKLDLRKTLFIVSTKSGGTVETLSLFNYFYNRVSDLLGPKEAGRHFAAITDPGSKLVDLSRALRFRHVFLNDPNIGGRFSALSFFGLAPAMLLGVDADMLLNRAQAMARLCGSPDTEKNIGARLGAVVGQLALAGRDKMTFILSSQIASFGDWVEQLVAESTGKEGKGILPVVGGEIGPPDAYGDDRQFVYLCLDGDAVHNTAVRQLEAAGFPIIQIRLSDLYDLGGQFFLWEFATAVAGHVLGIQPFDQPDVEAAKVQARKMVAAYRETGRLPYNLPASIEKCSVDAFLSHAQEGDYIAVQAYVAPTSRTEAALQSLRWKLGSCTGLTVTVGFGPRYLHSTGQLHKGDAGRGLFIQLTSDPIQDIPIPDAAGQADSSINFGVLKTAQALGDWQALTDAGRRVIRFHLGRDVASGMDELTRYVESKK